MSRRRQRRPRASSVPALRLSPCADYWLQPDTTGPADVGTSSTKQLDFPVDVERLSADRSNPASPSDPFQLSRGILTDSQISELRRRKKGKKVAKFHTRQNEVGSLESFPPLLTNAE